MDWKALLPSSIGIEDLELAQHPLDLQRARDMIAEARGTGFTDEDVRQGLREFLVSRHVADEHLDRQLQRLEELLEGNTDANA